MRNIILFTIILFASCTSVLKTETATSKSDDSTGTNISRSVQHSSADNLNIKRDDGSWTRTIVYPPSASLNYVPTQGIVVTESGTYNRDEIVKSHQDSYSEYNTYSHYNVYHHINVTTTTKKKNGTAWLPMLCLAIGGVGVFLATRVSLIVSLIMAIVKFVISKFQSHKQQTK